MNKILELVTQGIFATNSSCEKGKSTLDVHVECIEVYCEKLRDLLSGSKDLAIWEGMKKEVRCSSDLMQIIYKARNDRIVGQTAKNERSSRCHLLVRIHIKNSTVRDNQRMDSFAERDNIGKENVQYVTNGTLDLVDLAGSENTKKYYSFGTRQREGANINLR
jgi:kinesin family protein C2/C3